MKKLLLCVLALGCAAVLMACEWSAVPLPLEGMSRRSSVLHRTRPRSRVSWRSIPATTWTWR